MYEIIIIAAQMAWYNRILNQLFLANTIEQVLLNFKYVFVPMLHQCALFFIGVVFPNGLNAHSNQFPSWIL